MVKNSKKEENFIAKLIKAITRLNTENISSKEILEQVIQTFANNTNRIWFKHSKVSQIRYSLVVILELNSVSEVQYKDMMIDR